jgi:Putative amidoligase enzyme
MNIFKSALFYLTLAFTLAFASPATALVHGALADEGLLFVDAEILERTVGVEIELAGLSDIAIQNLILKHFGGKIKSDDIVSGILFKTKMGNIKLKLEGQAWRYESNPLAYQQQLAKDLLSAPREVVFPPIKFNKHHTELENFVRELKSAGALGTSESRAVSFQVNVQMGLLTESQKNVDDLVNLMRAYLRPEHRAQIDKILNVPDIRKEFLNDFSPGFMKRLLDPAYRPTAREFYDDFIYRQSLEFLGDPYAWTDSIASVRYRLTSQGPERAVNKTVIKMSKLRISSLLILAFPDDQMSKWIAETGWVQGLPIVEFREFNNTFSASLYIKMALGITRAAQLYGYYSHDELMQKIMGVSAEKISSIRNQYSSRPAFHYFNLRNILSQRPEVCQKLLRAAIH